VASVIEQLIENDIKDITNTSFWDSVKVPDLTDAIRIETKSGKSYLIALEKADEFAKKLDEKRTFTLKPLEKV
jgi:hypothetical protein